MQARRGVVRRSLVLVLTLSATAGLVSPGSSTLIPGGGSKKTDCYIEADIDGVSGTGPKVSCTDGDPCDHDGQCPNKSCRFQVRACVNQTNVSRCTPGTFKKPPTAFVKVGGTKTTITVPTSGCSDPVEVDVPSKGKGKPKPGGFVVLKGKEKGTDADKIPLVCVQQTGACATTTTTTTSTTTTTIACLTPPTLPTCGNGVVDAGEQCDPPCSQGQCAGGQFCNSSCQCVPTTSCACGASQPSRLDFTTGVGAGNCGAVTNGTGGDVLCLSCSGLYFGGGADVTPLPARVPDMGSSLTSVSACSDTCLTLANLTSAQTGNIRNCSSVGCLFGAPLPIPNTAAAPLSTCVINTVATDAQGFAQCDIGATNLNLPLSSGIFLTADLLNGAAPDQPDVTGLQPCPVCRKACLACQGPSGATNTPCTSNADCTGAGGLCGVGACTSDNDCQAGIHCSSAPQCLGGPNDGLACTPGSGNLGDAYPTTHDCPPPPAKLIGSLPIPFALTTGISKKTAGPSGTQQRVFCGFCRDTNTLCFEGDPTAVTDGCPMPAGVLHPCTADTDCAAPYPSCEQRDQGAFQKLVGSGIFEVGSQAGSLIDGAAHTATLVSVFCIPPTFNPAVDAAADLPGPGAVSLFGQSQLLP
jgi:hypothetical protein